MTSEQSQPTSVRNKTKSRCTNLRTNRIDVALVQGLFEVASNRPGAPPPPRLDTERSASYSPHGITDTDSSEGSSRGQVRGATDPAGDGCSRAAPPAGHASVRDDPDHAQPAGRPTGQAAARVALPHRRTVGEPGSHRGRRHAAAGSPAGADGLRADRVGPGRVRRAR